MGAGEPDPSTVGAFVPIANALGIGCELLTLCLNNVQSGVVDFEVVVDIPELFLRMALDEQGEEQNVPC